MNYVMIDTSKLVFLNKQQTLILNFYKCVCQITIKLGPNRVRDSAYKLWQCNKQLDTHLAKLRP